MKTTISLSVGLMLVLPPPIQSTNIDGMGTRLAAANDICCRLDEGYFCSSCGGSGCGKSAYKTITKTECDKLSNAPADKRYCKASFCKKE